MKFSKLYAPSTKEAPKDAVLPSHTLLLRAGFIQQCGSGLYNFLPLGKMVLDKIYTVVKDEMDKAGALQTSLSFVTSAVLWEEAENIRLMARNYCVLKTEKKMSLC